MIRRRSKHQQTVSPASIAPPAEIRPWQWFLLAAAAPIVLCAAKLNLDLWHDEIYTLVEFVAAGPEKIVTDYSAPNNHVFYSLLLWPVHLVSTSNFALRLPSLAFAAATLWLTFRAGCRLGNEKVGALATLLLGLNQMFLIHAMQVRGYGLSMLLFVWLVNLAIPDRLALSMARRLQIILVGAAFLYVMPTNLLFFLPLATVAFAWANWPPRGGAQRTDAPESNALQAERHTGRSLQRQLPSGADAAAPSQITAGDTSSTARRLASVGVAWTAAIALAAVCYAPIARQALEHRGPPAPFSAGGLFAAVENFLKPATHDYLLLAPLFLLGPFAWAVRRSRGKEAASPALLLLVAFVFCGGFFLSAALGISPFPRNFCPLLPLVALAQGWTLAELAASVPWKNPVAERAKPLAAALLVVAVLAPQLATYPHRLDAYCREHPGAHDGYFNYYAAHYQPAAAVDRVRELTADGRPFRVCFADDDHWNLLYYFQRAGQRLSMEAATNDSEARSMIYVVAPFAADWHEIASKCGVPAETLKKLPVIDDFGYYRLHRSEQPLPLGK